MEEEKERSKTKKVNSVKIFCMASKVHVQLFNENGGSQVFHIYSCEFSPSNRKLWSPNTFATNYDKSHPVIGVLP